MVKVDLLLTANILLVVSDNSHSTRQSMNNDPLSQLV